MLISTCTPVMNRTDDLRKSMPYRIEAALKSLPVEFVILNYNSQDGLREYVIGEVLEMIRDTGIRLNYVEFSRRKYYHQAHAYNLSVKSSHGEYVIVLQADTHPVGDYFGVLRQAIQDGYEWMEPEFVNRSVVCCKREVFYEVGGFDERFECYGPEDRDLSARLGRTGRKKMTLPNDLLVSIPTPNKMKVANYRIKGNKTQLSRKMYPFYQDNNDRSVVRANEEKGWGEWI